jgi:hypothetical protein
VEIFLNGSLRGKGGQLIEGLEPGTYEIEARKPHSRPWKDRITLVEGAVLPMEAKFEGYRLAIFPGRMTGRYVSKLSQGQKNSQWILTGVGNGGGATFYAGALKTAFSYYPYPNFGVKESPLEELENGTWKGIVFVELDEQFLFRKGRELDVDAVLTFEVDISDNSGPVRAYLADLLTNRVYRYKGDWKSGRLSTDVATGVRDVISQFRKNH